jgi:DNA-binding NtrC family response regulator
VALELGQWRAVYRQSSSRGLEGPTSTGPGTDVQARPTRAGSRPFQLRSRHGTTELLSDLLPDSFTVGQDPENEVVIQDRFISGRHLQVTRSEDSLHVRDLNSTNGTFLGSARIFEAELPMNTVLRVGETELVFEPVPEGPREAAAHGIIGNDPAVRHLVDLIGRVAPSNAGGLILGESGTGKELVARALHAGSPRARAPFVPVNCAALSPALLESELFGHEKGAFTGADVKRKGAFEEAHGGTLFLDEVGELPLELQAKLLRVLESGEVKRVGTSRPFHVDVRVVAATNRELLAEARQGRFRKDVYYRLNVMPLVLPPLRERRGDLRTLAEHFVRLHAPRGQEVKFTPAALARLQQYTWPGNIRELRSVVCRALLLRQGVKIEASAITFEQQPEQALADAASVPFGLAEGLTLEQMLARVERQLIEHTLRRCDFHKERTAQVLGLSRSALFKRLKEWGYTQADEES